MNLLKTSELTTGTGTRKIVKLLAWFSISLALSLIFFREFWLSLPLILSPDWIFGQYHASSWGVLALSLFFLYLRRKEVWQEMGTYGATGRDNAVFPGVSDYLASIIIGLALIAGALLMPALRDYLIFRVLLAGLGLFFVIFGMAARTLSILLAVYGFAISFPLLIKSFAETGYAQTTLLPLTALLDTLGYSLDQQGQWLHLTSFTGETITVLVSAACAGPATMGVFLAIFALMALDKPLPGKSMALLLLFGIFGTWLQSFVRLLILMLAGFHLGEKALWTAHYWTIYLLFPIWYLFFAGIYFRQSKKLSRATKP